MAPAASMDFNQKSLDESFLMSNMTAQLPGFNQQLWKHLKSYVRDWAISRKKIYVISGTIYCDINTIGRGVAIPSFFYKAIIDMNTLETIGWQ